MSQSNELNDSAERPDAEMTPRDTMYEFLVKVDSITSWTAHRHRLPPDEKRDLLAVSAEARRRYEEMKDAPR